MLKNFLPPFDVKLNEAMCYSATSMYTERKSSCYIYVYNKWNTKLFLSHKWMKMKYYQNHRKFRFLLAFLKDYLERCQLWMGYATKFHFQVTDLEFNMCFPTKTTLSISSRLPECPQQLTLTYLKLSHVVDSWPLVSGTPF